MSADALLGAPLFVVGCPGSGTSLVGDILGAHRRVAYWSDPPDIAAYYPRLLRGEVGTQEARAFYLDACRRWLAARPLVPIERFALRRPGHALAVRFLARESPDARILHVLRDGRSVARWLVGADCRGPEWMPADRRAEFFGLWGLAIYVALWIMLPLEPLLLPPAQPAPPARAPGSA